MRALERPPPPRPAAVALFLSALAAVQRYHAALVDSNDELHVEAAGVTVGWPVDLPVAVHLDVVPDLMRWTNWDGDDAWFALRAGLATSSRRG